MNKYERFAFRQLILNTLMPPRKENTNIFGNQFLYYLLGMHLFCKNVPENTKPVEKVDLTEEKEKLKQICEEQKANIKKAYDDYAQKETQKLVDLMNKESDNPLVKLDQLFTKYIAGFVSIIFKLLGIKKLDN